MIAVRNYARFSTPALPLEPDQLPEEDIMARLVLIAMGKGADADPAEFHEMLLGGILGLATQIPGSSLQGADPGEVRAGLEGNSPPELMLDALLKAGPVPTLAGRAARPAARHRSRRAGAQAGRGAVHSLGPGTAGTTGTGRGGGPAARPAEHPGPRDGADRATAVAFQQQLAA